MLHRYCWQEEAHQCKITQKLANTILTHSANL